LIDKSNMQ